jgi:hypothetical protein
MKLEEKPEVGNLKPESRSHALRAALGRMRPASALMSQPSGFSVVEILCVLFVASILLFSAGSLVAQMAVRVDNSTKVISEPTNSVFWASNAAGITNAIGANFAPAAGSTNIATLGTITNGPKTLAGYGITNAPTEAPSDSSLYARKNAAWERVLKPSIFPALKGWGRVPLMSANYGVCSDSTATPWVASLASIVAAAHPEATVVVQNFTLSPERMVKTVTQTGTAGDRYLALGTGGAAVVLCNTTSARVVTGDLDVRACIEAPDWTPVGDLKIITGHDGVKSSFNFAVQDTGKLFIEWSTNNGPSNKGAFSTVATGFTDGTKHWVRATLDVDNGAGGRTTKFYTSSDGETWTQLGSDVTVAEVTSIGSDWPAQMYLGTTSTIKAGAKYYSAEWRQGINGQILSPPIDRWIRNYQDRVIVGGAPVLTIYNGSSPGYATADWTAARCKIAFPVDTDGVIVALVHNDGSVLNSQAVFSEVKSRLDGVLANIRSASAGVPIVISTQNPQQSTAETRLKNTLLQHLNSAVATSESLPLLDVYTWMMEAGFTDSWLRDAAHPTDPVYVLWGQFVYDSIFVAP